MRIIIAVAIFFFVGISSATSQCPPEAKNHCGTKPFYLLVAILADTCARIDEEHAADYKTQLANFIADDPNAYAALSADPQFAKQLAETKRKFEAISREELYDVCKTFRAKP